MTKRLNLSPRAKRDIDEIWDFSDNRWGTKRANRYVGDIRKKMERVAKNPGLGRTCDDIHPGYLMISSGSHMIFYRRAGSGIRILRVLHQSMDFERHLNTRLLA